MERFEFPPGFHAMLNFSLIEALLGRRSRSAGIGIQI
jgi:hypothetical protein